MVQRLSEAGGRRASEWFDHVALPSRRLDVLAQVCKRHEALAVGHYELPCSSLEDEGLVTTRLVTRQSPVTKPGIAMSHDVPHC